MGIDNRKYAVVNKSSEYINVYSKLVPSDIHVGGQTVGGSVLGRIHPNEFYIVFPNEYYTITHFKILFLDGSGNEVIGYIERSMGYTLDDYSWHEYQYDYHLYNSNGSSLVTSASTGLINNESYRIFTVKRAVIFRAPNGTQLGQLTAGMQVACKSSTTGGTYHDFMVCYWKRSGNGSTWTRMYAGYDYVFVDLDLKNGAIPNNRALW